MHRSVSSAGIPVPSFGQLLVVAAACAAGWWGWNRSAENRIRRQLSNPSASVSDRMRAIESWAAGGPESVDALIGTLASADAPTRRDSARALGRIGPDAHRANPALTKALADPSREVRKAAIRALAQIDLFAPEFPELFQRAAADDDASVREAAVDAIMPLGPQAVPVILPLLAHSSPAIRRELLELVHGIARDAPEVISALRNHADDPDRSVRDQAARLLIADRRASPEEILSWLADGNAETVTRAIGALSLFGADAVMAVPELIACLDRTDFDAEDRSEIQQNALEWLRAFGPASRPSIASLERLLKSVDESQPPVEREGGNLTLWQYPPPALKLLIAETLAAAGADRETFLPVFIAALDDPMYSNQAGWLVTGVSEEEARRQVPHLVEQLSAADDEVRITALGALHGLGRAAAAAVPALAAQLTHESDRIVEMAAGLLGWLGPEAAEAVPAIAEQLKRRGAESRLFVELALAGGRIGPAAAPLTPFLMELIADRRHVEDSRAAAIEAITQIGSPPSQFRPLLQVALNENRPHLQSAALCALSRLRPADATMLPEVLHLLRSRFADVRFIAAWTSPDVVGFHPELVTALSDLLSDRDSGMRWPAAKALERLGPEAAAALPALFSALAAKENSVLQARFFWNPLTRSEFAPKFREQTIAEGIRDAIDRIAPDETAAAGER